MSHGTEGGAKSSRGFALTIASVQDYQVLALTSRFLIHISHSLPSGLDGLHRLLKVVIVVVEVWNMTGSITDI